MTHHVPNAHSPEQMRQLSNIGHLVEGGIIGGAGVVMLLEAATARDAFAEASTKLNVFAGGLLVAGLVAGSFEHGGPMIFFKADAQQREHLEMGSLLVGGGLARRLGKLGSLMSGLATARIGQMFLVHEQHGTGRAARIAKSRHQMLGRTIVGAAAATVAADLSGSRLMRSLSGLSLAAAGGQLLLYREPPGAYEDDDHEQ